MDICDMLFSAAGVVRKAIDCKMRKGMSEEDAVDELVDEVLRTTEEQAQAGVVHGRMEGIDFRRPT
jgi:tRNA-dihydrouridine synthase